MSIGSFLKGAFYQANPFDGGRTFRDAQDEEERRRKAARQYGVATNNRSLVERAAAQVNPFDRGATFNRPAPPKPKVNLTDYTGRLGGLPQRVGDFFEANSPQDQAKRLAVGRPQRDERPNILKDILSEQGRAAVGFGRFARGAAQDTARSPAVLGVTAGNAIGKQFFPDASRVSIETKNNKILRNIFGNDPIGGVQSEGERANIPGFRSGKPAALLGFTFAGLDAIPGGGKASKGILKTLSKADKAIDVAKILTKAGIELSDDVIPDIARIANTTDVKEIEGIIKEIATGRKVEQVAVQAGTEIAPQVGKAPVESKGVKIPTATPSNVRFTNLAEEIPQPRFGRVEQVPLEVTNKNTIRGKFQRAITDKDAPIISYLKETEKRTGQKGLVDQFYYDSGLQRGSNSIANARIQSSDDIEQAFSGLKGKAKTQMDDFVSARNELDNASRGLPTSRPVEELRAIVGNATLDQSNRFRALNNYYKGWAGRMREAGLISDADYKFFVENDNYTHIQRVMDDLANTRGQAGNAYSLGTTKARLKRTGSQREVQPSDLTAFSYAQNIQKEIQRNQTASNLIDVLVGNGHARRVTAEQAVRKNTIKRIVNGKTEIYEVPRDIKELIDNIKPFQLGKLGQVVAAPQRILRAGATGLSAPFTAANYVKDQASSAIISKDALDFGSAGIKTASGTHAPANILSGLLSAAKDYGYKSNDPLWQKFIEVAGDTTQYDFLRNSKNSKQLSREIRRTGGKYINMVRNPIRSLEDLNAITEKATRFQNFRGIYNKVLKETGSVDEATKQATLAAWQNSTDFARMGNITQVLNLLIPYFNAGIQGTRTMGRAFARRPLAFTAKTAAIIGAPLVGATLWNLSDPKRKAIYDNISDYEKENNLIVVLPTARQLDDGSYDGVIKIPIQQGLTSAVQPLRMGVENYRNAVDEYEFKDMAQQFLGAAAGPIETSTLSGFAGSLTPQVAKPAIQQVANKDLFTGKQIVPDYINNAQRGDGTPVAESDKAYKFSSGSARLLGKVLDVSPIRIEKFIKDTTGKVGQYTTNTLDRALAKGGVIPEEQIGGVSAAEDFVRRFARASGKENYMKSDGGKYYDDVKASTKGLNGNELAAWNSVHPNKTNFLGEEIFDENKRITNYAKVNAYINNPRVLDAEIALDKRSQARGNPGNPLWKLPKEQLVKVLLKSALPPGAKDPELSNLYKEEWYQDFQNARSAYYDQVKVKLAEKGKTIKKSDYPVTPKKLQSVMDYYNDLPKGTGDRSSWINANPGLFKQMTNQWAKVDAWENKERVAIGLKPVTDDASTGYGKYSYGSKGGNGRTKKAKEKTAKLADYLPTFKKPQGVASLNRISTTSQAPTFRVNLPSRSPAKKRVRINL